MTIELVKDGAAKILDVERVGGGGSGEKRKFQLVRGPPGSQSSGSTSSVSSGDNVKRRRQILRRPIQKQPPPVMGAGRIPESRAKEMVNTFANPKYQSSDDSGQSFDDDDDDGSVSHPYTVEEPREEEEEKPEGDYASIDDEKSDLLWKIDRASRQGMPCRQDLTIHSDVREIRNEFEPTFLTNTI